MTAGFGGKRDPEVNLRIALVTCVAVATMVLMVSPAPRPVQAAITTVAPTSGWLTQGFGGCAVQSQCHAAVDIAGPNVLPGNPVYAMASGVVVRRVMENGSYGCYLVIDHGDQGTGQNVFSLYSHMGWEDAPDHTAGCYFNVALGQSVTRGQKIGNQGDAGRATGVHLHFGVYVYPGPWSGAHHAFNPTACIGATSTYMALAPGTPCGADTCARAVADWCLFRATPSGRSFVLFGGAKFQFPDSATLSATYPGRPVWTVSDTYANSLPNVPRNGTLLRDESDGRIYVILGGARFHIPDETTLRTVYCPPYPVISCHGKLWHAAIATIPVTPANRTLVRDVSDGGIYVILGGGKFRVPDVATLRNFYCPSFPEGDCYTNLWHAAIVEIPNSPRDGILLRDTSDSRTYVVFGGARFRIPDDTTLKAMYCPTYPQQTCSQNIWHSAITAMSSVPVNDTLLKETGNPAVFAACQGIRWWIPNPTVFSQLGYSWSKVRLLWSGALTPIPVEANTDVTLAPPGDRQCDRMDLDDDNDSFSDAAEMAIHFTNPLLRDTDGDSRLDNADNCPNWSNSGQGLPAWPVAAGDSDCDGFSSVREVSMGTSPSRQCPATPEANDEAIDSWPTDMDDSGTTNDADMLLMERSMNLQSSDLGFNPRFDLNGDGKVNSGDLVLFAPYKNRSCS